MTSAPHPWHRMGSWRVPARAALLFGILPMVASGGCRAEPADEPAARADAEAEPTPPAAAGPSDITVADVGFRTPESVLHDTEADLYLVSSISGEALAKNGDGFISRVNPDGSMRELRWIDSASDGVTLNAPKGMAIAGDRLYVADIDVVRVFDRRSGAPLGEHAVEGAGFLNDVAAGPDGTIYVSDSGLDAGFGPSGTDAVFALRGERFERLAQGPELSHPNGLLVDGNALLMVPFGGATVFRIPLEGGAMTAFATLPAGQLDGIVRDGEGGFLVSSWEGGAIYRIAPDGTVGTVIDGLQAPADLGWDAQRGRVLIPLFMDDRIEIRTLGGG